MSFDEISISQLECIFICYNARHRTTLLYLLNYQVTTSWRLTVITVYTAHCPGEHGWATDLVDGHLEVFYGAAVAGSPDVLQAGEDVIPTFAAATA